MKKLVIDLDGTLTVGNTSDYHNVHPRLEVVKNLRLYKSQGFYIIISTSRNMRTYDGNIGKINVHTLPIIIDWLTKHEIPYDEIIVGKPWCGHDGFYIDDRAVRPSEFASMPLEEIYQLFENEQKCF